MPLPRRRFDPVPTTAWLFLRSLGQALGRPPLWLMSGFFLLLLALPPALPWVSWLDSVVPGRYEPGAVVASMDATFRQDHGEALGLLFQVTDDLLDATGDTATLGKTAGADAALGKATYVSILGLEGAEARADSLLEAGLEALSPLPHGDRLAAALNWVRNRRF